MQFEILYEDQDVLVVNKPAGVVVNRAENVRSQTLQDWFIERYPKVPQSGEWASLVPEDFDASYGSPEDIFAQRLGLVHRLDKETSGCLLMAKNPGAMVHLLHQFKERSVKKEYQLLVHGRFKILDGVIRVGLTRNPRRPTTFTATMEGRPAVTSYQVEAQFEGFEWSRLADLCAAPIVSQLQAAKDRYQGFSFLRAQPKTGRTHQLRVHFQFLKHPLVGDKVYAGKKRVKLDRSWCPRQFLHAGSLQFRHPRNTVLLELEAPLPDDLRQVLSVLHKEKE